MSSPLRKYWLREQDPGSLAASPARMTMLALAYTQKAHAARSATLSRSPELERLADAVLPPLKPGVVTAVFQPIVDLGGLRHQVVAVEALARGPKGTILESPSALFNVARRTNC